MAAKKPQGRVVSVSLTTEVGEQSEQRQTRVQSGSLRVGDLLITFSGSNRIKLTRDGGYGPMLYNPHQSEPAPTNITLKPGESMTFDVG